MPGGVFKEIAEQVYSRNVYMAPAVCKPDTTLLMTPYVKNGLKKNLELVLTELKLPYVQSQSDAEWVTASPTINNIDIRKNVIENGLVPDVKGMGARDALFLMEKVGLRVRITGYGKVTSQSIPAGSRIVKGSLISLELK